MAANKTRVPVRGTIGKSVRIGGAAATAVAVIGTSLALPDGSIPTLSQLAAALATGAALADLPGNTGPGMGGAGNTVIWNNIQYIPANILYAPRFVLPDEGDAEAPPIIPGQPGQPGAAGIPSAQHLWPEDPEDPLLIPGAAGAKGATGATGASGTTIPLVIYPEDPEDPLPPIPGVQGATGAQGVPGISGTTIPLVIQPEEFDDWHPIVPGAPGTAGANGVSGAQGPAVYLTAEEPDDWHPIVPGAPGPQGPAGASSNAVGLGWVYLDTETPEEPMSYGLASDAFFNSLRVLSNSGATAITAPVQMQCGAAGFAATFSDGTATGAYVGFGGSHEFQFGTTGAFAVALVAGNSERVVVAPSGGVTVNTPTSATALTLNGATNQYTLIIDASNTASNSFGLRVLSGTNASDSAVSIVNAANTATFMTIQGNGAGTLGPTSTTGISWNSVGETVITQGTASTNIVLQLKPNTSSAVGFSLLDPGANATQLRINTSNSAIIIQSAGGAAAMNFLQSASTVFALAATSGGATFSPVSGTAVTINAVAGSRGILVSPGDSSSVGIDIQDPGANGTDLRLNTNNTSAVIQANGTSTQIEFDVPGKSSALLIQNAGNLQYNQAQTTAASAAINTTETYISSAYAMAAGYIKTGQRFRIKIAGTCTTTAANVSTFTVRLGANGTTADAAMGTLTMTAGTTGTGTPFYVELEVVIRASGSSGTVLAYGWVVCNTGTGISNALTTVSMNSATTAVNLTGALKLGVSYKSAATTTTCTFQDVNVSQII